jgi:hypothetical protein
MKENRLIAEFMGVGKHYEAQSSNMFNQYHTDWNRLMGVIYEILWLEDYEDESYSDIYDGLTNALLSQTYDAVVEFINEFNKN